MRIRIPATREQCVLELFSHFPSVQITETLKLEFMAKHMDLSANQIRLERPRLR